MPGLMSASKHGPERSQRKRSHLALEDDGPVTETELERTKRVRISEIKESRLPRHQPSSEDTASGDCLAPDNHDIEQDDDDDAQSVQSDANEEGEGPSQYELMRDMGFEHLQYEEGDDMIATQRLEQRALRSAAMADDISGENRRAMNGIIERVTCVNFMCHSRLECELGPLLNFIVGENGSGKSAILTAITLCLGAKASTTNRGGSLKNFIKQGEERGFLAVWIKNCGDDAYEHDVYGDSIIVERHFSKSGTSSFKLKSGTQRLISTKRADVDDIVEYFYLQVDNPLNVLSQDNARQFLNSSSPALKYKFFVQGVQLEQLDKDYELIKQFLDAHTERIPQLEARVAQLTEIHEEADRVQKVIEGNKEMRAKKREYMNQLAWSQVAEQELVLQNYDRSVSEALRNIADAEQLRDAATQKLEIEDENLRRAKENLAALRSEEDGYKEAVDKATEDYNAASAELRSLHADERDIHSRLKGFADRVRELEGKIRDERQRLEDTSGDSRRETQARLDAAKARLQEVNQDISREIERRPSLDEQAAAARAETERIGQEVERKMGDVKSREARIRSLQQSRGSSSPYDAYDNRMPQLLALIDRDVRFSRKPIGPLGTKIRVTKPVWAPILEKTFGASLNGFIVTTHADQQHLSALIKRLGMSNVPVLIANTRSINTEGKEPDSQFDTILRILEFDDPLIRDQLIINSFIEQTIIIENRKHAEQIMFNGPAPQNVNACLALHDKKRGEGLRLATRGGNNVSTTPVVPNLTQKPRMKTDVSSQIDVQKEILAQNQHELDALRTELDCVRREEQHRGKEINTHMRRLDVLRKTARSMGATIREIEEELDVFDGADGRLNIFEQELAVAKEKKEQFGGQYGDVNIRKTLQNAKVEETKRLLDAAKTTKLDFAARLDKANRTKEKREDLRSLALVAKNDAFDNLTEQQEIKAMVDRQRDEQASVVEEFTNHAAAVCPRRVDIPEGETHASIEKKMESLVAQLEKRRKNLGMTDEEANNRLVDAKAALEKMKTVCEVSKKHIEAIEVALCERLSKWRLFQRRISANSRTNFIYLLSERGYRGKLLLDHKRKKLRVQVEPDETRRKVSGRDTRTLSGGEKSFSSICLLLAIWEAMGSPLRCLDEFDVFMDNVNRDVSTNMLVDAARRSVGRQYIFITPNAIQGNARHAPDVRIIRLTDPRQRTLDEM
ncbi:SMC6 protein [Sporothrix schenckii 1099-18]|uniref:SMC6 protein n=1 Tax=Sporothrix schenckii 1099-18 TaxID=1397361 RepID=A0A0F2LTQ3_SPOSC|nr:SMC6 protein [Sporothrix schenckii 1099-18]KJR79900.1 SMC6 protein [Sporothrix schenckii 1099-18]